MKHRILFPMIMATGVSFGFLSGCYTQLAVYDDEPVAYQEDENEAQEQEMDSQYEYVPQSRFWLSYSFGYPSWYVSTYTPYGYSPYYWDYWTYWNHTVIYPYPYWWDYPYYGFAHVGWYYHRPALYVYDDHYYSYRSGLTSTTRNSGVRRSGTARRRDYDAGRSGGNTRSSAAAASVSGRSSTERPEPGRRSPSIEFTRPRTRSAGDRAISSGRQSSGTRSANIWDIISRAASRSSRSDERTVSSPRSSSTSSDPGVSRSGSSSSPPSYSRPSAPSRSPAPARSSSGTRDSGSSRSRGSGRNR